MTRSRIHHSSNTGSSDERFGKGDEARVVLCCFQDEFTRFVERCLAIEKARCGLNDSDVKWGVE